MYQRFSADGLVCLQFNYSPISKHKWIVERWNRVDGHWIRSNWYRRCFTLEECWSIADGVIKSLKIPTKPSL